MTFLSWFQQLFDVFVDYSSRKFAPYQLSSFCNQFYQLLLPSIEENKENNVIVSFRMPSYIEGLKNITVTIPAGDVHRICTNFPQQQYSCMDVVKKHLQSILSVESSICTVEEIALPNVVVTKDGRMKVCVRNVCNV